MANTNKSVPIRGVRLIDPRCDYTIGITALWWEGSDDEGRWAIPPSFDHLLNEHMETWIGREGQLLENAEETKRFMEGRKVNLREYYDRIKSRFPDLQTDDEAAVFSLGDVVWAVHVLADVSDKETTLRVLAAVTEQMSEPDFWIDLAAHRTKMFKQKLENGHV